MLRQRFRRHMGLGGMEEGVGRGGEGCAWGEGCGGNNACPAELGLWRRVARGYLGHGV